MNIVVVRYDCLFVCKYVRRGGDRSSYSCLFTGPHRPSGSQEDKAPGIPRKLAHEGEKVVSPKHRPPLLSIKYSWYSFLLEAESTPGP